MKYDEVIVKLENIIENWYDREDLIKHIKHPYDGLCDNIKTHDIFSFGEVIEDWMYCDGWNFFFPVDGDLEYEKGAEIPYSLFNNPKRLHLAVHMLQWFRQHNI